MENLFRFILLRAASQADPDKVISLDPNTPLQKELKKALAGDHPIENVRAKARNHITDDRYDVALKNMTYLLGLHELDVLVRPSISSGGFDLARLEATIQQAMGKSASELVNDDNFKQDRDALIDFIVAIKLVKEQHSKPIADFVRAVRLMALIEDVAADKAYVHDPEDFIRALDRPVQLPKEIFPLVKPPESIRPAGVADLLIVKQALKRYQVREIAHIENVLRGELKSRDHRRRTMTEEIFVTETETVKEEERSLESTERFEMQREVGETIKEDTSLEAGLKVTGKYGPFVEFEASAKAAVSKSQERSTQFASDYASEVTSRSASKLTERFKQQRTRRVLQEIEETNKYELNNVGQSEHVVGIYQWVEKVYEAQVFNYGVRTMYEFMVPEPAAFVIKAFEYNHAMATNIDEPPAFTLTPDQISENKDDDHSYHRYVSLYEAEGVQPPLEPNITIAKVFRGEPDLREPPAQGVFVDSEELSILGDYKAKKAYIRRSVRYTGEEANWVIGVTIGQHQKTFTPDGDAVWDQQLNEETNFIPIAVRTSNVRAYTLSIEIECERTDRAMERWRQETHTAILQAYQKKRSDYEEKLSARQAQAGVAISGRHPEANRVLERDELKKSCITLLTRRYFGQYMGASFPGVAITGEDLFPFSPQVDYEKAESVGPLVRFFEQAFEWHNMTYVFYPYFWGRSIKYAPRLNYTDADPLFESFLRAGAARVVVPVRPGFEAAITHFMDAGMDLDAIWNGGELPSIGSDLYVPINVEMRERLGAPGNETPQGKSWEVVLPTSLVRLRADDSLPKWRKDQSGEWVPDE